MRNNANLKVLLVVAHPDDEYAFAATVYRIARELDGAVDQLVITNGEAGFRFSALAAVYYNLPLTDERVGRARLPEIRREETVRAGRILGIREHYFLNERDARFTLDAEEALSGMWDGNRVVSRIAELCRSEAYDFLFVLLPTHETHGHHQAAASLALEAVRRLPVVQRPIVLGSEPSAGTVPAFGGRPQFPLLHPGVYSTDRSAGLPHAPALNYGVIVNWVIAEHKSQGLFQTECGRHSRENFWIFDTGAPQAVEKTRALFDRLSAAKSVAA